MVCALQASILSVLEPEEPQKLRDHRTYINGQSRHFKVGLQVLLVRVQVQYSMMPAPSEMSSLTANWMYENNFDSRNQQ